MFAVSDVLPFCPSQDSSVPPIKNCCTSTILEIDRAAATPVFFELQVTLFVMEYALSDAGFGE